MKLFRRALAEALAPLLETDAATALAMLERPPKADMGDLALPCFALAKAKRQPPAKIAAELAARIPAIPGVAEAKAAGPYINFRIATAALADEAGRVALALEQGQLAVAECDPATGKPPVLTIDFSSPNIAKEFSVAHLRSTALGRSLVRLHRALGWKTVGINHLGDWGTQFGLLINAFRARGNEAELARHPIKHLQSLYVEESQRSKTDETVKEAARSTFLALEKGDPDTVALWKRFRDVSLDEFQRLYDLLDVQFDAYEGESFYNDKLDAAIERFRAAGLAREDQGAWIVDVPGEEAPLLLRKSDGASTYHTRDIAAVLYRAGHYHFARNLYCVDARQSQHFRQVFGALALLGDEGKRTAAHCRHVPFGTVTVDGAAMSTREGNVILLEDYIRQLATRAAEIVREKNAGLSDAEIGTLSMQVATGALVFEMLRREQSHSVDFRREESLRFEGETGPRLQYLHAARLGSLLRTWPDKMGGAPAPATAAEAIGSGDFDRQQAEPAARELLRLVATYPEVVERAAAECAPNLLCAYLHELCDAFNGYYRDVVVIDAAQPEASRSRIALVRVLRTITAHALYVLGIPAPERM